MPASLAQEAVPPTRGTAASAARRAAAPLPAAGGDAGDGGLGGAADVGLVADVGDDSEGLAAGVVDLFFELAQGGFAAGEEDDLGAALRGHAGGDQADAAGGASDDDDLPVEGLEAE